MPYSNMLLPALAPHRRALTPVLSTAVLCACTFSVRAENFDDTPVTALKCAQRAADLPKRFHVPVGANPGVLRQQRGGKRPQGDTTTQLAASPALPIPHPTARDSRKAGSSACSTPSVCRP